VYLLGGNTSARHREIDGGIVHRDGLRERGGGKGQREQTKHGHQQRNAAKILSGHIYPLIQVGTQEHGKHSSRSAQDGALGESESKPVYPEQLVRQARSFIE
jgi:hypothetical protein